MYETEDEINDDFSGVTPPFDDEEPAVVPPSAQADGSTADVTLAAAVLKWPSW